MKPANVLGRRSSSSIARIGRSLVADALDARGVRLARQDGERLPSQRGGSDRG
jgi:hypothetical protein